MQVFVVLFLSKFGFIFRTFPAALFLATYRYTISEDPGFIAENHGDAHGSRNDEKTLPLLFSLTRPVSCKIHFYRQYDG
ncbi:hypothetical protein ARMSODRAFT_805051 [Armillaria solidipes]|uniref:Uncharacterized protein n=1 Tax=Armillaria solidipes TaxID=1076256 RepID=A0A2H3AZS8_9AGAR|nr:hypothetical protein ARMSODRAFT_805051 [Armillaria solidipes]